MKYKDKDGNMLYGFSQVSLDKNNELIRLLIVAIIGIGGGFLILAVYVLNQIMKWNILTNYIQACVG